MLDRRLYSLSDVADIIGCKPYQITYLLTTRQVPEPARIGNKRVFSIEDVFRISQKLDAEQARELLAQDERQGG